MAGLCLVLSCGKQVCFAVEDTDEPTDEASHLIVWQLCPSVCFYLYMSRIYFVLDKVGHLFEQEQLEN